MAELEQLALDPLVSPAVILGGEPLDHHGDLGADRWAARPGSGRSTPRYPGGGASEARFPVRPQTLGQEAEQCGEDRAVGPVPPWSGIGVAQHGNLVPQHEELKVLGCR